jgi:glutathione S-transferase
VKIYSSRVSPFGERITIALRAKGIAIELAPLPAGGLRSPEYLAINPIAKVPALVTDSGNVIPESLAILNYIEDRFPSPSLLPNDPEERARMNVAIQVMDSYVMAPVIRTFPHLDPTNRDESFVAGEVERWKQGLAALAHFMKLPMPQAEAGITLADCVLPTSLHLSTRISRMLGIPENLLASHDVLVRYYSSMCDHPIVGPILDELTTAQAAYDAAKAAKH